MTRVYPICLTQSNSTSWKVFLKCNTATLRNRSHQQETLIGHPGVRGWPQRLMEKDIPISQYFRHLSKEPRIMQLPEKLRGWGSAKQVTLSYGYNKSSFSEWNRMNMTLPDTQSSTVRQSMRVDQMAAMQNPGCRGGDLRVHCVAKLKKYIPLVFS